MKLKAVFTKTGFHFFFGGALAVLLNLCAPAQAQNYSIDLYSIDGGGGSSSGGTYSISGTIGQPDAGRMSGGNYVIEGGFWGGIIAIQQEGVPTLRIQSAGSNFSISWSPNTPGFALQYKDNLSLPSWQNAPSGPTNPVSITPAAETRFYRLTKP